MASLWKEVLSPFEPKHIEHVFKNHISNSSFMPTVYDIRTALIALKESRGSSFLTKAQQDCKLCDGTGWKPVETGTPNRAVARCDCRAAEKQGK